MILLRQLLGGALLAALLTPTARAQSVGIGTTTPTQRLDVNGTLRVRATAAPAGTTGRLLSMADDGTLQAQPSALGTTLTPATGRVVVLNADGSLGSLDPAQLPGYGRRAVALGAVGSSGTLFVNSGNFTVTHPATGNYRLSFSGAGGLSAQNLSAAALVATLFSTPGLVSYQAGTGYVEVFTFDPSGAAADRGFSFSLTLP